MNFSILKNQTFSNYDSCRSIILNRKPVSISISIFNLLFNTLNIIIFFNLINKNRKNYFYRYFMIKSITDVYCGIHFIIRSWVLDLKLNSVFYSSSKEIMICFIIFSRYMGFVVQLISKVTECFISYDRFIILKPSNRNSSSKTSKIIYCLLIIFSFIFYIYKFFQNRVPIVKIEHNITFYSVETRPEKVFKYIDFLHSFMKDFLCLLISFIFNLINLYSILGFSKKKRYLTKNDKKSKIDKINKHDLKIIIMIIISTTISIIGHWSNFITFIPIEPNIFLNTCFEVVTYFFVEVSYAGNFIIYIIFNKLFRVTLLKMSGLKTNIKCESTGTF